ncbi:MAG: hypothetical protein HUJ55_07495 [Ileibacterium sp.]|nr:hypothetical protein [Ileibacterium sp.]
MKNCPKCHSPVSGQDRYCSVCHTDLTSTDYIQALPETMPPRPSSKPEKPVFTALMAADKRKKTKLWAAAGIAAGVICVSALTLMLTGSYQNSILSRTADTVVSAVTGDSQSGPVTRTCKADVDAMNITIEMTAPTKKSQVEHMVMDIYMPATYFGMEDTSSFKAMGDAANSLLQSSISESLGIDAANLKIRVGDVAIGVTIDMDAQAIMKYFHLNETSDLSIASLERVLQKDNFAKCD